jgi:glucose/mannose transport system permease protein
MHQISQDSITPVMRPRIRTGRRRLHGDRLIAIGLISPSLVAIAVFVYGFIGFTAFSSFTKWDSLSPDFTLVGWRNYARLFAVERFLSDLRNTFTFTSLFLLGCLGIGLGLAILLDQRIRGVSIFRTIFLFPMAIAYIVTGVVWRWLLNPGTLQTGSSGINLLFDRVGLGVLKSPWFTDPTILSIPPDSTVGMALSWIGLGGLANPHVGISVAMISVVLAATWQMSGYTMALYLAGLQDLLFPLILFGMFIPYQSILIPLVQVLQRMGLYGSLPGLIFVHVVYGIPITTLIFRNYYAAIPSELLDAGKIDGAGILRLYRYIIFPISIPGFVVVMIWQFTSVWNDFLFGVIVTSRPSVQPITVALNNMAGSYIVEWNVQMAGSILAAMPTLLVYILLGRYFMRGLLAGSLKG